MKLRQRPNRFLYAARHVLSSVVSNFGQRSNRTPTERKDIQCRTMVTAERRGFKRRRKERFMAQVYSVGKMREQEGIIPDERPQTLRRPRRGERGLGVRR